MQLEMELQYQTVLDAAGFGNTFGCISITLTSANVESGAPIGATGFTLKVGDSCWSSASDRYINNTRSNSNNNSYIL
jgi:hypothetical protein